jgi:hypothetical protein
MLPCITVKPTTESLEVRITRLTPACSAASSTFQVPTVLVVMISEPDPLQMLGRAAMWTMASWPLAAAATDAKSSIDALANRIGVPGSMRSRPDSAQRALSSSTT